MREPVTFRVPAEIAERVRGAVKAIRKTRPDYTSQQFGEDAIAQHLQLLADEHNGGKPFKRAQDNLPPGPPPA
jgi:hypothetical protein